MHPQDKEYYESIADLVTKNLPNYKRLAPRRRNVNTKTAGRPLQHSKVKEYLVLDTRKANGGLNGHMAQQESVIIPSYVPLPSTGQLERARSKKTREVPRDVEIPATI